MIATALTTALVDYVPIAHIVNQRIVKSMPVGKYHERHNVDAKDPGVIAVKAGVAK